MKRIPMIKPASDLQLAEAPSLYRAFERASARYGARSAVKDGAARRTWTELERDSRAVARALIACGIGRGDRCAIWAVNQLAWIAAGLALQAVGATLIPLGTRLKAREVGDIMRRGGVKLLFCDPAFGEHDFVGAISDEQLPELARIVCFGDGEDAGARDARALAWRAFLMLGEDVSEGALDQRIASVREDDIADILFTSGTTGTPKGVPMRHAQSLIACAAQQRCVSRFAEGDVFAVTYPFAHNAGYRAGWQAGLLFGASIIPVRSYTARDFLQLIDRERVTCLPAVPTIQQAILAHPDRGAFDLSSIRNATTGATTIPVTLIEEMQAFYGNDAVSTGYGLTEAAGSVSHTRPSDPAEVIAKTTGRPLDNLKVKLVDALHREVARGEPGEIAVRGPQVMDGYFEDEAATKAAFTTDGFMLTGDVGVFDAAGNLSITDRIKDMFIVGGFNAYPAEIENQMRGIDGVADVAVVGVPDARLGQVGHAFVVRAAHTPIDEAAIIAWCRGAMANYKAPRGVTFVDALPLNASGKVSKAELRVQA